MRKLASIQEIAAVEPIPGADAIEVVRVLGWKVVARKGEYRPGDRVVYVEIDSLLPERDTFEFLRKSCYKPEQRDVLGNVTTPAGFRIRTVKLRGQVSQGICFPLEILPEGAGRELGTDVTEALGIVKWEPPVPAGLGGKVKGGFPGFLPKTDETRIQAVPAVLDRHRGTRLFVTEKLDGTSFTAFLFRDEYGVCSRNLHLDETDPSSVLVQLARGLEIEAKLRQARESLCHDVAIQAEVIGPGIQGNKYKLAAPTLRVFNVLDLDAGRLLDRGATLDVLDRIGLEPVPTRPDIVLDHSVDDLVALAEGPSQLVPSLQREGIVLRPESETYDEDLGGRFSFKVINPKFLLKYDE